MGDQFFANKHRRGQEDPGTVDVSAPDAEAIWHAGDPEHPGHCFGVAFQHGKTCSQAKKCSAGASVLETRGSLVSQLVPWNVTAQA